LIHEDDWHGAHSLRLRSMDSSNQPQESTVIVHYAVGTVTRFQTPQGTFDIELLDDDAPIAVENFLDLMSSYTKSIIHRSIDGFVIQGGGFTFDATTGSGFQTVPTVTPITNEFDASNPNRAGTLSMALVGGNINSGTTQWFINTVDNSSLDTAKHTVFGRVIGTGMSVVNAINDLTTFNLNGTFPESSLATVPLTGYTPFTKSLTGTVSVGAGAAIVTGTGTSFTTELRAAVGTTPGSAIRIGDQNFTVASIVSNTQLTLSAVHVAGATNVTAKGNAAPVANNFVQFTSISEIL
jgi:cyclophilin family peptidyl-prolyl cis-trans isomerase